MSCACNIFQACQGVLGAMNWRMELFWAKLFATWNVLIDLAGRQTHLLPIAAGCSPRVPPSRSPLGDCVARIRASFSSHETKSVTCLMCLDIAIHKMGGPVPLLNLRSSLQYGSVELLFRPHFPDLFLHWLEEKRWRKRQLDKDRRNTPKTHFFLKFRMSWIINKHMDLGKGSS